jgi:serine/threonine-protein kinase
MKKWFFRSQLGSAYIKQHEQGLSTVRKGPGAVIRLIQDWGHAPTGTELTGELFFGDERVYGRFTQARIRGGEPFPVCVQLRYLDGTLGLPIEGRPAADTALVNQNFEVEAVAK